jgi:benzoyl-CoA-dihydrodiol lyase
LTATASPATSSASRKTARLDVQTSPDRYRHWRLAFDGDIATLVMQVDQDGGLDPDHELKLNSYDIGVDFELADALARIRFEHPQVRCVVVTGGLDRVFCAGANIPMLASSPHGFKVNFCKFTNETRLYIEDASERSNVRFLAALNGTASGGGYELAIACDKILLVDDRSSAVSYPELPLLGVLPGTGGLTRISDKRKIRRDRCDVFSTLAEGIKGKRALEWGLVDAIAPLSKWDESVGAMARELADGVTARGEKGIDLVPVSWSFEEGRLFGEHVSCKLDLEQRVAELEIALPDDVGPTSDADAFAAGAGWWWFQLFRELDLCLLDLRLNFSAIGLVTIRVTGRPEVILEADRFVMGSEHWFVREVKHFARRVLKRLDNTAKSLYAVADEGTAFAGSMLEIALACDRQYVLSDPDVPVSLGIGVANAGVFPMANGLSRLATRFLATPEQVDRVLASEGVVDAETADELGLATFAPDDIDWEDELRLAIEERASFSPDGLTGMEANIRFAGPETMETKIFGRLSAWQNWIFQRPNAVGEKGALRAYGTPQRATFDYNRT